jgi:hypothetical protein
VAPPHRPNIPTGVFRNLDLSSFLSPFSPFCGFIFLLPFLPRSSPSGAAAATGTAAVDAVVGVAPGPAPVSKPRTPEGIPEDVVESKGEPEAVPEVAQEEAPADGAMIAVRVAVTPPSSRGACTLLLSAPRRAAASGAVAGEGMEVVLGHPTPYAPGDFSVSEAVSTAHQALSQAQRVLHHEGEDLVDERRRLQLWASMLKRTMMSERVAARARQHDFDLQVEAIAQRDADSRRALTDARELYASAEAQASVATKQEEEFAARARQVNQREQEVEKLEGLLQ